MPEWLTGPRARWILSATPVILGFMLTEYLVFIGAESFTAVLSIGGVISLPIFGGIFPVLLLVASRRRGDMVPQTFFRFLGHPLVLSFIYAIYMASFLAHGLIIWQDPLMRLSALAVGLAAVGISIHAVWRKSFIPRTVVELRQDAQAAQAQFAVVARGEMADAKIHLEYKTGARDLNAASGEIPDLSELTCATFQLPPGRTRELTIWAHQIKPEGNSEGLPAQIDVTCDGQTRHLSIAVGNEEVTLPVGAEPRTLTIQPV